MITMPLALPDRRGFVLADVERELARGLRAMCFSRKLERAFDAHERLTRSRYLVVSGAIGCVLYVAFLAFDWQLVPDVFDLACLLRLAVFMPLMVGMLFVSAMVEDTAIREGSRAVMAVVATVIIMSLVLASRSPYRCPYHYGTLLIMVNVAVQRLRVRYAAAAMAGMLAVHMAAVFSSDAFDGHMRAADPMFFLAGSTFLLTAIYGIEREARRGFLLAMEAGFLHEELERRATLDPLTGLGNRRRLDTVMATSWKDVSHGSAMAILVIDVDHFKSFNDGSGHVDGDGCLMRVANSVLRALEGGPGDAIRFGGDEFVLFLPGADRVRAVRVAAAVVRAVRNEAIPHPARASGACVTVSVGVSVADPRFATPEDLLRTADRALYAAKAAGRDRACFEGVGGAATDRIDPRTSPADGHALSPRSDGRAAA